MLVYGMYAAPSWAEAVLTSKAYVDNKVPAYASGGSASLLTDTDTTGTIAKRAIFTDGTTYVAGTHANQIPTMGAVMSAISAGVSSGIDTLSWTSTETTAANAYSTTFDGTPGNWPAADGAKLINGTALGTALSLKQNKIPAGTNGYLATHSGTEGTFGTPVNPATFQSAITAHAANAADSLLTDSQTTGTVQKRAIFNDTAANYNSSTQSTHIPTMGAVMSAISSATPTLPTGTPGSAVLYDNNGDIGDERAISSAAVYTGSGKGRSLSNGTDLATIAAVETKQNAITPATAGQLVAYDDADDNGQATFTAVDVMDDSDVGDVVDNHTDNGIIDYQSIGTEIERDYADNIITGAAMGRALVEFGLQIDTNRSNIALKQDKLGGTVNSVSTAGKLVTATATTGDVTYTDVESTSLGTNASATSLPTTGVVVSAFNTKFPANGGTDKVVTLSSTAGAPSSRNIVTTLTSGGTNIPTDGAVYSAVNDKQDKLIANNATTYPNGSLVTYNTLGNPGAKKIVTTIASGGTDIPTDGAVYSAVNAKQTRAICSATKPGDNTVCYAYTFADIETGR